MKKLITLILALMLSVVSCFALTGCSEGKTVKEGDTIVIGVTDYAPLDYIDETSGEWVGFDAELATKVFTNLGYKVEFKEIDWDTKIVTLNAGTIDCIWNGMTVNEELLSNLLLTTVYLKNKQVIVAKNENLSLYNTQADLVGKTVAVESGSSAQYAAEDAGVADASIQKLTNQNSAILAVNAGTADVAIVDYALAKEMTTSQESQYSATLSMKEIGFEVEEFSAAVRKSDSKLLWEINKEIAKLKEDGTIANLALKYGVMNLLPENVAD